MAPIDYSTEEGNEYHRKRHPEFFDHPRLMEAWSRYARQVYFPQAKKGDRFLEIGAGLGVNLLAIKDTAEVYAVEPAKIAREHCLSLGIRALSSLDEIPSGIRFDWILLRHVLEHLQEPRALLLRLLKCLSSEGRIIIVLPTESPYDQPVPDELDHHLYCWNRKTISNLLTDIGYRVIEAKIHWFNGRRIFLPVYQAFGVRVYGLCLGILGRLRRISEMIITAERG